jgi:AcrR family transcriptional regulator
MVGAGALNLRKLAARVGVSHAAVYRHFADKQALVNAVAEAGFMELSRRFEVTQREPGDLKADLRALLETYVAFALEHPQRFRLITTDLLVKREVGTPLYAAPKEAYRLLLAPLERAEQAGQLRDNAAESSAVVWASFHGAATLLVEGQLPWLADDAARVRFLEAVVETLLKGLRV